MPGHQTGPHRVVDIKHRKTHPSQAQSTQKPAHCMYKREKRFGHSLDVNIFFWFFSLLFFTYSYFFVFYFLIFFHVEQAVTVIGVELP